MAEQLEEAGEEEVLGGAVVLEDGLLLVVVVDVGIVVVMTGAELAITSEARSDKR